jgi:cysteine desulfurase / selenocysteine lyase
MLKWAPVTDEGEFILEEFEKLLTARTGWLPSPTCPTCWALWPVKDVVRLAHDRGIPVLIDGSQAAVHLPLDVRDIGADFYVFTGHKLYGPTGIGVLYGQRERLNALPPFNGGGEMIRDVTVDSVTYGDTPHRFEAGTPPIVQAIGLAAALDYIDAIGREKIAPMRRHFWPMPTSGSVRLNRFRVFGTAPGKGAIVSSSWWGRTPMTYPQ